MEKYISHDLGLIQEEQENFGKRNLIPKINVTLEHLRPKTIFAENTTSMKYYHDEKQGNNEEYYASAREYIRIKDISRRSMAQTNAQKLAKR